MSVSPLLHKAFQDAAAPERLQRAERARLAADRRAASATPEPMAATKRRRAVRPVLALLSRLG